ncbi:MAG: FAD-binding protein [Candidatus Paceibacterota bacterium]
MKIQEYVDIRDYSSLHIGGQFRYFVKIDKKDELGNVYLMAREKNTPIFILGGGSNIVFSDGIIDVFAIKIEIKGFEIIPARPHKGAGGNETEKYADIKVGAGEIWDKIVEKTVEMNLQGLEALSAIPGTVGATPVQNVGAYGVEVKDTILEVEVFDIKENKIKTISNKDCKFGYRDSIFKNEDKGKYIITAVTYRLNKVPPLLLEEGVGGGDLELISHHLAPKGTPPQQGGEKNLSPALGYPGVSKYFEEHKIENPNLKQIREAIIEIRKEKLPNPKEIPNVGSFFKNPIVSNSVADKIKADFPNAKFFPLETTRQDLVKIPAGWLIENAGLKGKSFGNVSVYDKNALVLVNNGNATKEDLINARNEIIKIVEQKFGITLEQEPEII